MTFSKTTVPIISRFLLLVFVTNSCVEQKITTESGGSSAITSQDNTNNATLTTSASFSKNVGAPIESQTGLRWMKNFANAKPSNVNTEYIIPATTLKGILSNTGCVGISLYYAMDANGQVIIVPVGVNLNGKILPVKTTALQSSTLDWATVMNGINSYTGRVRAHFFGADTFNRLLIDQNSPSVRISPALDDSGNPQLLMSNASVSSPTSYQDMSVPCPPVCPN